MKNQQGYTALIIMLCATAVFVVVGFFILRKEAPSSNDKSATGDQTQEEIPVTEEPKEETPVDTSIPGWSTYTNTKYGYSLQHPPTLKVGSISGNSALGTYDDPVRGFDVGSLVFVSLTGAMRTTGAEYFNSMYASIGQMQQSPDEPLAVSCKADEIDNPEVAVKSVSCVGEGGPARYALIIGSEYDIFVDGYSKGFDDSNNGELSEGEYEKILGSFRFPTSIKTQAVEEKIEPGLQSFSITANDTSANPTSINVPKGTIVNLTINVSGEGTSTSGLSFKSSVVNSGTILPGASKTIAFTVTDSFNLVPYGPTDVAPKSYKISVIAQ